MFLNILYCMYHVIFMLWYNYQIFYVKQYLQYVVHWGNISTALPLEAVEQHVSELKGSTYVICNLGE